MSYLKTKSEHNLLSAEILINNGLHAPSVHCSYYSSFQLSKYALKEFSGIDYEEQNEELNQLKQTKTGKIGTHEYVINRLGSEIRNCSKDAYRIFTYNIKKLKKLRTESDYFDFPITDEQSKESLRLSKELIQLLKLNCHL
ncbi:MAG: HEPN domain-containing protein [Bacteroidota bacterium]|nr:HEPN domain-containing protein [Bacteroidota bacterium]